MWRKYGNTDYAIITVPFELEMKKRTLEQTRFAFRLFEGESAASRLRRASHGESAEPIDWTPQGYYFADLGKIPVGGLSLSKFNAVQEPLILSELDKLTNLVEMAKADALRVWPIFNCRIAEGNRWRSNGREVSRFKDLSTTATANPAVYSLFSRDKVRW